MAVIRCAEQLEVEVAAGPHHAHPGDPAEVGHRPTGGDHGFGGDAVPEIGRPTNDVPLDERDVDAQTGGMGGGLVAGRPAPDDHKTHETRLRPCPRRGGHRSAGRGEAAVSIDLPERSDQCRAARAAP